MSYVFGSGIYRGSNALNKIYRGENPVNRIYNCEDTQWASGTPMSGVNILIIGGGGGGGTGLASGAGGAGGYREFTKKYYTDTNYTVTIGAGGSANANGSNSSVERIGTGGGAGGSISSTTGGNGGSGGGGGGGFAGSKGSTTSPRCNGTSQGNNGSDYTSGLGGGGGGGAGATTSNRNGGSGTASSITGSSVTRAGGGGGGDSNGGFGNTATPGSGGSGGGGNGGSGNQSNNSSQAAGDNGTVNTGGGGGGGAYYKDSPTGSSLSGTGGNGGSGFVVLKFPDTYTITIGSGLTSSSSTSGGYTIVQFTAGTDTISFSIASGGSAPMTQSQTGGYSWLGDGSASNKFRLTGQGANPRMRGDAHSPYHSGWNSSNAPKWTINTAGTLNVSRTGWDSSDDEEDHQIYKNGSLALTLSYDSTSTSTLSVAANDVIEYRGAQFGSYGSDTYIVNPEFWVS
jgi:hypothetical protein